MWAKLWGLLGCSHPKSSLACHSTLHLSWKPLSRRCAHGLLKGSVRVARLWQGSVWYLSHLLSAPHPGEPGGVLCLILAVGWHWTSSKSKGLLCPVLSAPQWHMSKYLSLLLWWLTDGGSWPRSWRSSCGSWCPEECGWGTTVWAGKSDYVQCNRDTFFSNQVSSQCSNCLYFLEAIFLQLVQVRIQTRSTC